MLFSNWLIINKIVDLNFNVSDFEQINDALCHQPFETKQAHQKTRQHIVVNPFTINNSSSLSVDRPCYVQKQMTSPIKEPELAEKMKAERQKLLNSIQMISSSQIERLSSHPVKTGSHSDVFQCKWNTAVVALKQLRFKPNACQMDDIQLCFQMRHPNIVALFGMTKLENNYIGLVMEWADQGSLTNNMEDMTIEEKIKVSICVCEGLAYMHSSRIVHKGLTPENVLLFGDKSIAKISDFGTCTVTSKYSAPELMHLGLQVRID
jgi:hypothetical protein